VLYGKRENVAFALKEKQEALRGIEEIEKLVSRECPGMRPEKLSLLRDRVSINKKYVSLYADVTKALMFTRYLLETDDPKTDAYYREIAGMIEGTVSRLVEIEAELRVFYKQTNYLPHTIYTVFDPDRVKSLRKDLQCRLKAAGIVK